MKDKDLITLISYFNVMNMSEENECFICRIDKYVTHTLHSVSDGFSNSDFTCSNCKFCIIVSKRLDYKLGRDNNELIAVIVDESQKEFVLNNIRYFNTQNFAPYIHFTSGLFFNYLTKFNPPKNESIPIYSQSNGHAEDKATRRLNLYPKDSQ